MNDQLEKSADSAGTVAWLLGGWRPWLLVVLLGCVLYLPFLGSHGLWDPWEPHYAEVAREMVVSGNWLDPTWEHSPGQSLDRKYFFSKPALIMWMMALPMKIFGVDAPGGGISPGAEWYIRFPFFLTALVGLLGVFGLARRFFGTRIGLLAATICGSSAMYYFIARQAMTDMPLVGLMTAGVALLLVGGFDERERPGLLYAGYALCGLAVLAKGLVGFALPGLVFLLYFLISGDWQRLRRMRLWTGGALALLVAMPWYVYMSIASATRHLVDDEGKTFFTRFFLHDHIYRLFEGVHGDRGTFVYFVKQLGLGAHPWFPFMMWGGVRSAQRLDGPRSSYRDLGPAARVELFVLLWGLCGLALYSLSVTKFHHYILPAFPSLAVLAAVWLERLRRGEEQLGKLILPLMLVLGVVIISRDIGLIPKNLVDLFVYNYTRAFPKAAALPGQIGYGIIYGLMSLGLIGVFIFCREKLASWMGRILVGGALAGAIWGGWYFFGAMSPHWSQRHLFDTYYALRKPTEPIGAYLMNWRGETFYSTNTVTQLKSNARLRSWLASNKKSRRFVLVEQHRLNKLKDRLSVAARRSLRILDRSCNKFYLVSIEPDSPTVVKTKTAPGKPEKPPAKDSSR